MCIWSDKPLEKKIAKEDIEVIKVLKCTEDNKLTSPYMTVLMKTLKLSVDDVTWVIGETKKVNIKTEERIRGRYMTTSGLYSCKSVYFGHGKLYKKFRAIIPKGSEYYEDYDKYCSNQLKIVEEIID